MIHMMRWLWSPRTRPNRPADLGAAGERHACRLLRRCGYRVLAKNMWSAMGELDLVAEAPDRRTIVFVEVKTRAATPGGSSGPPPEANITAKKQRKLLALAHHTARRHGWLDRPWRIDVIAIEWPPDGAPIIRHHQNAITR